MIVPNYIPEPIEVPGNVTEEPYGRRLRFVRRVTAWHLLGLLIVAALSRLPWPPSLAGATACFVALVLGLDLLRIRLRGQSLEARLSVAALPVVLASAGWLVAELDRAGLPVWALATGPLCAAGYTALCGRDYSFLGNFTLSMVVSTVFCAAVARPLPGTFAGLALAANAAYLTYFVYDLASLMARRRTGEELAAVTDLYRDVFNVLGYAVRCVSHWRKHRIFSS